MNTNNNGSTGSAGLKLILRALKYRNYRLFFLGQGISLIGTWMQQLALSWLVYRVTGSAFYLGLVTFCNQIPVFLAAPLAGVFADRLSRHKLLIVTQVLSMIQAFLLAALVTFGAFNLAYIILLSLFMGIINAFDMPVRQAFVYELVDDQNDLPNAIALNSLIFNSARLIGPSVAGFLIAAVGEGACFLINGISYLAVLAALAVMKLRQPLQPVRNEPLLAELKAGFSYAFSFVPIRTMLLLLAATSLVAMPYSVLMPIFAKSILGGGPETLGFLMGSVALGALVGALFLASLRTVGGLDKIVTGAILIFAAGIALFSFSQVLWLSLVLIGFAGFGIMIQIAGLNTIIQTIVDDDKRGRIMSLHVTAFIGVAPLGSLLAGGAAETFGAQRTMQIISVLAVITAIIFWRKLPQIRRLVHPIYVRKGIIPELAAGLGTASQIAAQTKE